jgi:hypothetical protein
MYTKPSPEELIKFSIETLQDVIRPNLDASMQVKMDKVIISLKCANQIIPNEEKEMKKDFANLQKLYALIYEDTSNIPNKTARILNQFSYGLRAEEIPTGDDPDFRSKLVASYKKLSYGLENVIDYIDLLIKEDSKLGQELHRLVKGYLSKRITGEYGIYAVASGSMPGRE